MTAGTSGTSFDGEGEWVVLCEGFHDRAFLAGLLGERLGMRALRNDTRFDRGHHGYTNHAQAIVRVVPCGSHDRVSAEARRRLARRTTDPLRGLVLVLDEDMASEDKAVDASDAASRALERLRRLAERHGGAAEAGDIANGLLLGDGTRLFAVAWSSDDPPSPLLPRVQCLERLVAAALSSVYPRRGAQVAAWLSGREDPPLEVAAVNKAFTWSHMAGWYADRGCDAFLKTVWADAAIATALTHRLQQSGSWDVIQKIVNDP